jgi:hypothetical protein
MTLLRVTKQLEKERATRLGAGDRAAGLAILWTVDQQLLPEGVVEAMAESEYVALDLYLDGAAPDNGKMWSQVRGVERITSDAADYGRVYDVDGELVGLVHDRNRGLTTISVLARGDGWESSTHPDLVRGRARSVGELARDPDRGDAGGHE